MTETQASDARSELETAVSADGVSANLLLAWRDAQGQYRTYRVQTDAPLSTHLVALARSGAADLLTERYEVPYDPEWPLKNHEFFAIPNDPPVGGDLFEQLADYANRPWFSKKDLTKPKLYTVALTANGEVGFFGKRMANLQVLNRRSKLLKLTWDGSVFHELEDSVATFSPDFDWIVWKGAKGTMYVLNSAQFHAEFRDIEGLRTAVEIHISQIRSKIEIENYAKMIERCQRSVPMASKLKQAAEHGIADMPIADLKKYAAERGIEVTWNGD